jgi:protein-S-isoprenylcysteine O-methyltransferase Ste14
MLTMLSINEKMRLKLSWVWMVLIGVLILSSKSNWADQDLVEEGMMALAMGMTVIGCLGRIWCFAYISGKKNDVLVTDGPYSLCRNPLYFFSILGIAGVGLSTCTFTVPLLILIGIAIVYPSVIKREEERLLAIHGYSYSDYCARVPKLIPSFKYYHPASHTVINVDAFTRGMRDTMWLFLALVLIHLKNQWYEQSTTDVWLNVW